MLIFKIISGHWCSPITVPQDGGCPCGNSNCWAEQSSVRKPHTRASAHSCVYPCEYPNSSSIWTFSRIDRTHNSLSPYEPTHVFGDISVREKIYHTIHICSSSRPCGLFFGGVARNEGEGTSSRICYKWVPGGRVSSPCAVISCGEHRFLADGTRVCTGAQLEVYMLVVLSEVFLGVEGAVTVEARERF